MATRVIDVEVGDRTHRVMVEPGPGPDLLRVTRDGVTRVVDVRRVDDRSLSFVYRDGAAESHDVTVLDAGEDGVVNVHLDGAVLSAAIDRERRRFDGGSEDAAGGVQRLVAPMPGKVVRRLVDVGDEVTAKQGVIVVEAMKMENEIAAVHDGTVVAFEVEDGQSVEAGTVLVVIE